MLTPILQIQTRRVAKNERTSIRDAMNNHNTQSSPKSATKRLFSDRNDTAANSNASIDPSFDDGIDDDATPRKRHCGSDWPLASDNRVIRNRRSVTRSPSSRRRNLSRSRPSRFLEGSMNDRTSNPPPVPFLGADEWDSYENDMDDEPRGRRPTRMVQQPLLANAPLPGPSVSDREVNRTSGLFRFGRSLANSFNPSNWKIFSKQTRQIEETPQEKIMRERKEKAEQLYQELKASGNFREYMHSMAGPTSQQSQQHHGENGRSVSQRPIENRSQMSMRSASQQPISDAHPADRRRSSFQLPREQTFDSKHDSGISFGAQSFRRVSLDTHDLTLNEAQLFRPEVPAESLSPTVSDIDSFTHKKRSSFQLKKASFVNLKKASSESDEGHGHLLQRARKVPSRKDLQKQQKLVKKVSDLESRLIAARRQLSNLNQPVSQQAHISRPRFVPGALASLPSERLLAGYLGPDVESDEHSQSCGIGQALTTDEAAPNMESVDSTMDADAITPTNQLKHDALYYGQSNDQFYQGQQLAVASDIDAEQNGVTISKSIEADQYPHSPFGEVSIDSFTQAEDANPIEDYHRDSTHEIEAQLDHEAHVTSDDASGMSLSEADEPAMPVTPAMPVDQNCSDKAATGKITSQMSPHGRLSTGKIPHLSASPPDASYGNLMYCKPTALASAATTLRLPAAISLTGSVQKVQSTDIGLRRHSREIVPPVPAVPKSVRLPSGEIINTAPTRRTASNDRGKGLADSKDAKLNVTPTKSNAKHIVDIENLQPPTPDIEDSTDWPDYVF